MDIIIKVFLPLSLAFIMFSLGLGLTTADFVRVVRRPVAFLVGAVNQVLLVPIITFLVILLFDISGEIAVGFLILAACPGGVTSNMISRLAKADVALSVSLTAVISLSSVITVPLIIGFAFSYFMAEQAASVNVLGTALTMFALTAVPILLGLGAHKLMPIAMDNVEPIISKIAAVLFFIVVIAAIATNWGLLLSNLSVLGPALIVLLILLLSTGYVAPRLVGRTTHEAKTVSIETGIQNSTLGITVAALLVGGEAGFTPYSLPAAVYGILMYVVIAPALLLFRRID